MNEFFQHGPHQLSLTLGLRLNLEDDIELISTMSEMIHSLAKENQTNNRLFMNKGLVKRVSTIVSSAIASTKCFDPQVSSRLKSRIRKVFKVLLVAEDDEDGNEHGEVQDEILEPSTSDDIPNDIMDDEVDHEEDDSDPEVEESESHVRVVEQKDLSHLLEGVLQHGMRWTIPAKKVIKDGVEITVEQPISHFYKPTEDLIRAVKAILLCPIASKCNDFFGIFSPT
jgi:hypothetical protein